MRSLLVTTILAAVALLGPLPAHAAASCDEPNAPAGVIKAVPAFMPPEATRLGVAGDVTVVVTIDNAGAVLSASVSKAPNAMLNDSALAAARATTYRPARVNCETIGGTYRFIVRFESLPDERMRLSDAPFTITDAPFTIAQDGHHAHVQAHALSTAQTPIQSIRFRFIMFDANGTIVDDHTQWIYGPFAPGADITTTADLMVGSRAAAIVRIKTAPDLVIMQDAHFWQDRTP